jgi:chromosome segregation ATPase
MHEGDELRAVIEQKERDIASLDELGNRLKEKLNLKDDQIEHLKEKLDLKDDQIENLKNKLNLKDVQIEHLKNKLDDKDVLIDKLKGRLDQKDVLISRLSESQSVSVDDLEVFEARVRAAEIAQADVMPQDEGSLDE